MDQEQEGWGETYLLINLPDLVLCSVLERHGLRTTVEEKEMVKC